jgi:plasmid stabilization system protein ParE
MAAEYRLSARADRDLTEVYIYTFEKFGELQADRYLLKLHDCMQRLAQEPGTGRVVHEVTGDYRRLDCGSHGIFYQNASYGISVVRVLHLAMDFHIKPSVFIGLMRLDAPWEASAWLRWGGWNACPFPWEHCAVHRYWQEQYGAEVVSITHAIVQCVVPRPPSDRRSALALAEQQYYYCADIVQQGVGTIEALAALLLNGRCWYFWWD